jgi:hypothetical protein
MVVVRLKGFPKGFAFGNKGEDRSRASRSFPSSAILLSKVGIMMELAIGAVVVERGLFFGGTPSSHGRYAFFLVWRRNVTPKVTNPVLAS